MKKSGIVSLIAIAMIITGIALGGISQMIDTFATGGYSFTFESDVQRYDVQEQVFYNINDIEIKSQNASIEFTEHNLDGGIRVSMKQAPINLSMYQSDDVLIIDQGHKIVQSKGTQTKITISVPTGYVFDEANIYLTAGSSSVTNLKANDIEMDITASSVELNKIVGRVIEVSSKVSSVQMTRVEADELEFNNYMGNFSGSLVGGISHYNYDIQLTCGQTEINGDYYAGIVNNISKGTGYKSLSVDNKLGSITLRMED